MADREDLEIEVAAGGAAHFGRGIDRLRLVDLLAVDHQPPALAAVGRRQARPRTLRPDQHEAAGIALGWMADRSGVRSITLTERLMNGTPRISMPSALRTDEPKPSHATMWRARSCSRSPVAASCRSATTQSASSRKRRERAAIAQRHRRMRARRARQDRVEHELRAMRERLRAAVERLRLGDRRHRDAADLVAGQAGDEHVVERKVAREAPVLHLLGDAPAAAELDRADAGREHLCVDDLAVALLDQRARHAAPAEIEREREADRSAADDEDGGHEQLGRCDTSPACGGGRERSDVGRGLSRTIFAIVPPPQPSPASGRGSSHRSRGPSPPDTSSTRLREHP